MIFPIVICTIFIPKSLYAGYRIIIKPTIVLDEEYIDNLFLSDKNKQSDIITLFSSGISAEVKTKTNSAVCSYDLTYSHYNRFSKYDTWRHKADLSGIFNFSRYTNLNFQNTFSITEDPDKYIKENLNVNQQDFKIEPETIRRTRDKFLNNSTFINLTHKLNQNNSLILQYQHDVLRNDDPLVRNKIKYNPLININLWPVPNKFEFNTKISYIKEDVSDALEKYGYSEESTAPWLRFSYWVVPKQLNFYTEISYIKGIIENNDFYLSDTNETWYESFKSSFGIKYCFLPNLTFDADTYIEQGINEDTFTNITDDFKTLYTSFKLTKTFSRRFDGFFQYAQGITNFKGYDEDNPDYKLYEPSLGIKYLLAENLPLFLNIGYLIREKKQAGRESAITLNSKLGTWQFNRYIFLTFQASSGYQQDYVGAEQLGFGIYYDASINIEYIFSKYIKGYMNSAYQKNKYIDLKNTRNDTDKKFHIGLIFQPKKYFTIKLGYIHHDLNSTKDKDNYKENRILLQFQYQPYPGYIF